MAAQQGTKFDPKTYVSVHERIEEFWMRYPNGSINTEIIHVDETKVIAKAWAYRDASDTIPAGTGHAEEIRSENYVNASSALENAETSAVGRALGFMGFKVKRGLASQEEMLKVQRAQELAEAAHKPLPVVGATPPKAVPPAASSPAPTTVSSPIIASPSADTPEPPVNFGLCPGCGKDLNKAPFKQFVQRVREKPGSASFAICPDCYRTGKVTFEPTTT